MEDITYNKVKKFIEKHHMIAEGDLIVTGVSGGADSVCLLHLLWRLQREIPYRLVVVHVNHQVRADAVKDAMYVARLCERLAVPYILKEVDMEQYAAQHRLSSEEAGRILRYQAFEEVLADQPDSGGHKIAVAHNANDRAETMLFHMFRGSGVKGVGSIRPVRESVIRPVLCLEREEIEAYLKAQKLSYCTDSTNGEDTYTRNKIRHHILPYAEKEICQGAVAHMGELADILSDTEDYLEEQTGRLWDAYVEMPEDGRKEGRTAGGDGQPPETTETGDNLRIRSEELLSEHPVMVSRVLLFCLERMIPHRKDITGRHIVELTELMRKEGSKALSLPGGVRAYKEYGTLYLVRENAQTGECSSIDHQGESGFEGNPVYEIDPPAEIRIPGMGDFLFTLREPDPGLYERIFCNKEQNIPENRYTKWFDYDKITTSLLLRTRRQGDYLTIDTALRRQSVKQYMINEKIPKIQRAGMYLLTDGSHVVWIPGYRISQYYKVDESTKRILQVSIRGGRNGRTS